VKKPHAARAWGRLTSRRAGGFLKSASAGGRAAAGGAPFAPSA